MILSYTMQLFKKNFFGENYCPNSPLITRALREIPEAPSSPDSFFEETNFLDQEPLAQSVIGKPEPESELNVFELEVFEPETLISNESLKPVAEPETLISNESLKPVAEPEPEVLELEPGSELKVVELEPEVSEPEVLEMEPEPEVLELEPELEPEPEVLELEPEPEVLEPEPEVLEECSVKCISVILSEITESYNNLEKDKDSVQIALEQIRKLAESGLDVENAIGPLETQVTCIDNLLKKFFEQLHLLNNELKTASSKITN